MTASNPIRSAFAAVDTVLTAREIRDAMRSDRPSAPVVMVYSLPACSDPHSDSLELTTDDVIALAGVESES